MINPFDPFNALHLSGVGTFRYATLALPTATVRRFLPHGLELGPQPMTPPGTHPVMMGFHEMFRLHTTVPSLLPSMTYHEHSVGIPYCCVAAERGIVSDPGPYFFMPAVLLDHVLATIGGMLFWGYAKQLAAIGSDNGRYTVARVNRQPLVSYTYEAVGVARPIAEYPHFEVHRQALSQPVISLLPLAIGPFFALAGFPKHWEVATLRPLATVTEVFTDCLTGLSSGPYPPSGRSDGIDASVMGSYEFQAPWQLTSPHPLPLPAPRAAHGPGADPACRTPR